MLDNTKKVLKSRVYIVNFVWLILIFINVATYYKSYEMH